MDERWKMMSLQKEWTLTGLDSRKKIGQRRRRISILSQARDRIVQKFLAL